MALLGHIRDFQVHGTDFPTRDGTAVRDYIHVSDLAEAHVLALRYLLAGRKGDTFNLGVGKGYSVKEVLAAISGVSGRALNPVTGARRQGDPAELVADAKLARDALGFTPKFSDLRTIVEFGMALALCRSSLARCMMLYLSSFRRRCFATRVRIDPRTAAPCRGGTRCALLY